MENYKELGLNSETAVVFNITSREQVLSLIHIFLKRKRQEPQHRGRADFSILGEADVICRLQFIPNGINLRWI